MNKLYEIVRETCGIPHDQEFVLSSTPDALNQQGYFSIESNQSVNFSNGDMIFLHLHKGNKPASQLQDEVIPQSVDESISQLEGTIPRKKDSLYCNHGSTAMCTHCSPLEPYDDSYLNEKGIKHMSYYAYCKKLADRRASIIKGHPEAPDYQLNKENCQRCRGKQDSTCIRCGIPSPVTLDRQPFRMVDHIEFDDGGSIIEEFLANGWRKDGRQQFAWLLGRYAPYDQVPLGIKAVVSALYIPPQQRAIDGFHLDSESFPVSNSHCSNNKNCKAESISSPTQRLSQLSVDKPTIDSLPLIKKCLSLSALSIVGMMYTDLQRQKDNAALVEHTRGPETYFVSSSEVLLIAEQQTLHPFCPNEKKTNLFDLKKSVSKTFGSRLVTLILSGDQNGAVSPAAYQVSLQAEALYKADFVQATTDPAVLMVHPNKAPDIMYSSKAGVRRADPTFPVDFLLISLTHGFPVQKNPLFPGGLNCVPLLTTDSLKKHLFPLPVDNDRLGSVISSFGVLYSLVEYEVGNLKSSAEEMASTLITKIILDPQNNRTLKELVEINKTWKSFLQSLSISPMNSSQSNLTGRLGWACPHCTFFNPAISSGSETCSVCTLPRYY